MKRSAPPSLSTLTDQALLDRLNGIVGYGRRVSVRVLDYLNEVESRRLHFQHAFSSMFAFCRKRLRFSEGEAVRKIAAARLMKRFPEIRALLESATVHMSTLLVFEDEFTAENVTQLLCLLAGKTKRQAEHLLGEMHPDRIRPPPSVANQLRKLPPVASAPPQTAPLAPLFERPAVAPTSRPPVSHAPASSDVERTASGPSSGAGLAMPRLPTSSEPTPAPPTPQQATIAATSSAAAGSGTAKTPPASDLATPSVSAHAEHYLVGFQASKELRDKLERLRALMAHENPSGDLAKIVERAADLLIAKIEKERFGQTDRPRKPAGVGVEVGVGAGPGPGAGARPRITGPRPSKDPSHISNETKRIVLARDGWRCTFVGEDDERCTECRFLQFDHIVPRALGGTGDAANVRVRCAPHNRFSAEQIFGKELVAAQIHRRQRRQSARARAAAKGSTPPPRGRSSPRS